METIQHKIIKFSPLNYLLIFLIIGMKLIIIVVTFNLCK